MIIEPLLVMKAAHYIQEGIPLKDVMTAEEVETAILMLSDVLLLTGFPRYDPDEDYT